MRACVSSFAFLTVRLCLSGLMLCVLKSDVCPSLQPQHTTTTKSGAEVPLPPHYLRQGALRLSLLLGGSGLLLGCESASNGRQQQLSPHCLPVSTEKNRCITRRHLNCQIQMEAHTHTQTHTHTHRRTHTHLTHRHTRPHKIHTPIDTQTHVQIK